MDRSRANTGRNRRDWFSQGEKAGCLRSLRLEPVPRQQKSPWRRAKTMVSPLGKSLFTGNGGLAGTRTQDQRLKRPLLYQLSYQPTKAADASLPNAGLS